MTRDTVAAGLRSALAYGRAHVGAITLTAALVAVVVIWRADHQPAPLPAAVRALDDSLRATRADVAAAIDTLTKSSTAHERAADRSGIVAARHDSAAVVAGRLADSLGELARRSADSAGAYRAAYEARTAEAIELRGTIRADSETIGQLRATVADERLRFSTLARRDTLLEQVNGDLRTAAERAGECRILWRVKCPTRAQAFGAGAALTLAALATRH